MPEDDPKIVHRVYRGAWAAAVCDRNIASHIKFTETNKLRYNVCLYFPNGYSTDWPIRYDDGRIGYESIDNPPRDAKRAVEAAFRWIDTWIDEKSQKS